MKAQKPKLIKQYSKNNAKGSTTRNKLRLKKYDRTPVNNGTIMTDVTMDQYGRIFEEFYNEKDKRMDYRPTGLSGCANH